MIGAFMLVVAGALSDPPPATGVPECDRYVAAVRACLPKMCEDERLIVEMDLGFAVETIAAVVEQDGRAAAADTCSKDLVDEARKDLYGCHAGSPAAATRVELTPVAGGVVMRFSSPALAGAEHADVAIAEPLAEPVAVYRVTASGGTFVLDTRTAPVLGSGSNPVQLTPDAPYCYSIATAGDDPSRRRIVRKGVASAGAP